jgi:hypothetical protein
VNITEAGKDPIRVNAIEASGNFFGVIGVQPLIGTGFPVATFYSRDRLAVISHRLWRERFNGDPAIIGKPITLSSIVYTVSGVMPPGFNYPNDTDVWQRLQWDFAQHSRGAHFVESLFRLKPAVSVEQANAELRALTTRTGRRVQGDQRRLGSARDSARARSRRLLPAGAVRAVRRRRVPVAHHVHECREPAAGARDGARARGGRSRGHRGEPWPARHAVPHRERHPGRGPGRRSASCSR